MAATSFLFLLSAFCLFLAIIPRASVVSGHRDHDESSAIPHLHKVEIDEIVKKRKEVMLLVHKESCGLHCDDHIDSLESAMEEVKLMGAKNVLNVVASMDEEYFKLFNTKTNVILVFYRSGVPILYEEIREDKLLHPENIVQWISETRKLRVKHLNDDTFEHDTQAASGATTGDWFVMFYKPGCYEKFLHKIETLNYRLQRTSKVVAKVDLTESKELEKRFAINKCPSFILFRNGKMYEYEQQKYDVDSLHNFATTWFSNAKSRDVPIERSPFDLITDYAVNFIKRHHGAKEKVAFAAIATLIAVVILVKMTKPAPKIEAKKQ